MFENDHGFYARPTDVWFSDRGCPLITQPYAVVGVPDALITVERYQKWYNLFLIHADRTRPIEKLDDCIDYPEFDGWYDHCPRPEALVKYCIENHLKMELQVYHAICCRYCHDISGVGIMFTSDFGPCNIEDNYTRSDLIRVQKESIAEYNPDAFPTAMELSQVLFDQAEWLILN